VITVRNPTPEQCAELEAYGAAMADRMEADDYQPGLAYTADALPPALALRVAATRRAVALRRLDGEIQAAVDHARAQGLSWHKIALPLAMTAEGARRKFAHTT
jgi:hypothetical protein